MNNFVKLVLLSVLFSPILLNLFDLVFVLSNDYDSLNYFFKSYTQNLIKNSFLLSTTVTVISILMGAVMSTIFFAISSKNLRYIYIMLIFIFFAIEPIIYLSAFNTNSLFNSISAFWQSSIILSFSMSALSGLVFIFALSSLNQESIKTALMVASKRDVFKLILKPQLLFILSVSFFIFFILVFSRSEVPSILGYRTYAEDFLAQVFLMDEIKSSAIAAMPFYLLALLISLFVALFIKKYHIKFSIKEQINFLLIDSLDQYTVKAFFLFLTILLGAILTLLAKKIDFYLLGDLIEDNIFIILNSLIVSLVVSVLTLVFSLFIYKTVKEFKSRLLIYGVIFLIFLIFLTPSTLIAFEIIKMMQFINIHTEFIEYLFFILASSFKLIPLAVLLVSILYYRDVEDESLQFFNITAKDYFLKITIQTYAKRWLFIVMIISVFALNELSMAILLTPIGFEMIIIKIYNLLHYGDTSTVTFLSLMQIVIIASFLMILWRIVDKVEKKKMDTRG